MKKATIKKSWGFNLKNIDNSIRPQDDFYGFANGGWIKRNKMPADESRWGSFNILRFNTERQLHHIVLDILRKKSFKVGSREQLVADTYRSALNMKRRNALGIEPLLPTLTLIRSIATPEALLSTIASMHKMGIAVPWEFYLDQDAKDSSKYLLHLQQDGLGMPEREYYLSDEAEYKRVREAYLKHIKKILTLSGMKSADVARAIDTIMKIETKLARASMKKEDARDSEKTYHKYTIARLQKEVPQVVWATYFKDLGAGRLSAVNVSQPEFCKAAGVMLRTFSIDEWKIYLEWHLFNEFAGMLSEKFVRANWEFYAHTLTGARKQRALWRRALGTTAGVGEALGALYVEKHFSHEAKRRMNMLVDDLFAAYESRIKKLDWMSESTKQSAVAKLHAMNRKIGYPEKFEAYKGLAIRADDFLGNMLRTHEFYHKKAMHRLHKAVDRKEWQMTPQTVNAYCHFNLNEIVFPAAILQPPFFFLNGDDAVNYGAIGSVISHEISHGFDDQGSKFNARGNMISWWSSADRKRFDTKAKVLVKQFNQYTVSDGVRANGQLTLGENIADLGGAAIALDAYRRRLEKTGHKTIDGFTPLQRFFLGFAQAEQEIARPEFKKFAAAVDPHSAAEHRVNGPVSNIDAFYEAFALKKNENLYRDPKNRAKIW